MVRAEQVYRTIGRKLRETREGMGLSQADVARQLGISDVGYSRWESGTRRIQMAEFRRVAELFGKPVSYFLGEDFSPEQLAMWRLDSLSAEDKAFVRQMVDLLVERRSQHNPEAA